LNEWKRAEPKEESCTTECPLKYPAAARRRGRQILAFEALDLCCTKA
jgi:hypothetical protein